MDRTPERPQRIHGVRYRKEKRERYVDFTFKGQPKRRKEKYDVWVPVPPVNLDRLYLRVVIGIALCLTLAAAVWSTTAIGRLLKGMVPGHEAAGYIGAAAFEVPWVGCLIVQWLLRDEPDRAKPAVIGGWIGLSIVVGAVLIDGFELNLPLVGAVAACISIAAKAFWWLVLHLVHRPLDEEHAGQIDAIRQDHAVSRTMLTEQSRMGAMEAWMAEVYGDNAPAVTEAAGRAPMPELPVGTGQVPDTSGHPSWTASMQVTPPAGVPVAPAPAPVAPAPTPPPVAPPAPPAPAAQAQAAPALHAVGGPFKSDTIRAALGVNPAISDEDLIAQVNGTHGYDPKNADSVPRLRRRIESKAKKKKAS